MVVVVTEVGVELLGVVEVDAAFSTMSARLPLRNDLLDRLAVLLGILWSGAKAHVPSS